MCISSESPPESSQNARVRRAMSRTGADVTCVIRDCYSPPAGYAASSVRGPLPGRRLDYHDHDHDHEHEHEHEHEH